MSCELLQLNGVRRSVRPVTPPAHRSARPATLAALLAGLFVLLASGELPADELLMMNGDRLTGTVIDKSGLYVILETPYAGQLRILGSEIRKLTFAEPRKLLENDESLVNILSLERVDGEVLAVTVDKPEPHPIDAGKLTTPVAGNADSQFESAFTGFVNVRVQTESGNNEKTEVDLDYDLTYRRQDDRIRSQALVEIETKQGNRTKQDWDVGGQYDHFFSRKLYAGAMLVLKQEKYADLDLRTVAGPIVGYQVFESKARNLLGEFGVLYVHENYTDQASKTYWGPGWRIRFDHYLFGERLQFYHNQISYMSAEDINKFIWTGFTGFRLPLMFGFVASTELELDYDGKPANAAEKLDTTYRFKLGYRW